MLPVQALVQPARPPAAQLLSPVQMMPRSAAPHQVGTEPLLWLAAYWPLEEACCTGAEVHAGVPLRVCLPWKASEMRV